MSRLVIIYRNIARCIKEKRVQGLYRCVCGTEKVISESRVNSGVIKSCGCLQREAASISGKNCTTHGMKKTPEWSTWNSLKNRCNNPKTNPRYAGRGIKVCDRWLNSFENFYEDMGDRPSKNHSIDRIDNKGNYEPSNCKWATSREQNNNRSISVKYKFKGLELSIPQWSRKTGINSHTIWRRLNRYGWSIDRALTEKPKKRVDTRPKKAFWSA